MFHKSQFDYDLSSDSYRCPAGKRLQRIESVAASAATRQYSRYASSDCADCPLRARCTKAKARRITRYPQDEARDALRQVMQQTGAQRVFRKRQGMVEPVFPRLCGRQRLDLFRRKGLAAVRREFALHVLAYNLARAVRLARALDVLLSTLGYLSRCLQQAARHFMQRFFLQTRFQHVARWLGLETKE